MDEPRHQPHLQLERMVNMNLQQSLYRISIALLLCLVLTKPTTAQEILNRPPSTVLDVAYSSNGYLAQISAGGQLQVWATPSNQLVFAATTELPNSLLRAKVAWSTTGDRLAVGIGGAILIYSSESWNIVQTMRFSSDETLVYDEAGYNLPEGVVSLAWDSVDQRILVQTVSSRYLVWSFAESRFTFDQLYGNNPIPIVWLPGEQAITSGSTVLDLEQERFTVRRTSDVYIDSGCASMSSSSSSSDQRWIAQGTLNGCIKIVDALTGDEIAGFRISTTDAWVTDVQWSNDDRTIIAVTSLGEVYAVDLETSEVALIVQQPTPLYAVDWSPSNTEIAFGGVARTESSAPSITRIPVSQVEAALNSPSARVPEAFVPFNAP
jgi:WD40 repeat protein